LRFEPPGPSVARYVLQDIEIHGQKVPAGSAMLMLVGSANRDERRYPDGDRFDIHRQGPPHITFGRGIHACLGSALARVEGRVALDELLKRFPEWEVDLDNAKLSSTSTVRGWDTLPAFIGAGGRKAVKTSTLGIADSAAADATRVPGADRWELTLSTPMGPQKMTAQIVKAGDSFKGSMTGEMGTQDIEGKVSGNSLTWILPLTKPVSIKLKFDVKVDGDQMTGNVKLGMFGNAALVGKRLP